jgi:N-acylneuraminate cytidylyltransferase
MLGGKKILGLVCARGGSKGILKKNLKQLGGKPLVAWSIEAGRDCPFIDRLIVSTDDDEIASVSESFGAEVPFMRPAKLAADHSPEWAVWQHAVTEMRKIGFHSDYLIVLPPTSPFRSGTDIIAGIEQLHKGGADIIISVTESGRNPYFNMIELGEDGLARLAKTREHKFSRRQDAPKVYDITTVLYAAHCDYVLKAHGIFEGQVKTIIVPDIRAVDIDTELDLKFAEFLIQKGLAG